jgi:hypothetical protein
VGLAVLGDLGLERESRPGVKSEAPYRPPPTTSKSVRCAKEEMRWVW